MKEQSQPATLSDAKSIGGAAGSASGQANAMRIPRVAVLASGEGTTAEAVQQAWLKDANAPRIELIICNNPDAGILTRLPGVESVIIKSKNTEDEDQAILDKLLEGNYDLIWLAGYMKKIGPEVVSQFGWRKEYTSPYQAMMVNIHPGLLPQTKGLIGVHVQELVLEKGLKAGHTLHVVSEDYDEGPEIAVHEVEVLPHDTPETLFERVKISHNQTLPRDLADFIAKRREYLGDKK